MEGRVALIPEACKQLLGAGHAVILEQGAGALSGYDDECYAAIGVEVAGGPSELYAAAQLILKVKEPQASELALLNRDHLLFSFLHLAAEPALGRRLQEIGLTAVAFETVEEESGRLPLLAPMSDIAGRIAAQVGTCLLHQSHGGKGLLLGGLPAAERGRVIIIGAGTAGGNAAVLAAAAGAEVVVFDINRDRLAAMRALGNNVTGLYPYEDAVAREVSRADIVIGAVLKTGARAPHVVTRQMISDYAGRRGSDRYLGRPGRLHGDHPADHLREPDLQGRRRDPFCGDQYARRGAQERLTGPVGRPAALCPRARPP